MPTFIQPVTKEGEVWKEVNLNKKILSNESIGRLSLLNIFDSNFIPDGLGSIENSEPYTIVYVASDRCSLEYESASCDGNLSIGSVLYPKTDIFLKGSQANFGLRVGRS